jgi:hypothetical protein
MERPPLRLTASHPAAADGIPVLALDLALQKLARLDQDLARIVELRAFGGLTIEEAACLLDVSPSTAKREWRTAKAWLGRNGATERRPGRLNQRGSITDHADRLGEARRRSVGLTSTSCAMVSMRRGMTSVEKPDNSTRSS